ncbi:MAG: LLM class F420-dependent oxidoreductase [Acidimicrobiales bacterium]|jgi:probable F420-dependent oxidoreductase|nr:LLM class F420-dependent oxidoreductase [Acidimicrobiales bacterium]
MELGRVGIWQYQLDLVPSARSQELAAEVEALGYGAIWIPEAVGREAFTSATLLLSGTERIVVATGIASIWARDALCANSALQTVTEAFPERFLLGLGVSHQVMVEGMRGHDYTKPYSTMKTYLDQMDAGLFAAVAPSTPARRVLAALGPKMLRLAAERTDGAHPYFVPVEHTAFARETMGEGPLLCVEQAVVLEADPDVARRIARAHMSTYLTLPNYTNNLKRCGFTDADIADGGTDRLVDAIVAWGDEEAVAARVAAHHDAGADHVCIQVLPAESTAAPVDEWRRLAPALLG